MGARPSGRFSVNEPTRLEFSESCGRCDSEAASTPRSDADELWMHGCPCSSCDCQLLSGLFGAEWGENAD